MKVKFMTIALVVGAFIAITLVLINRFDRDRTNTSVFEIGAIMPLTGVSSDLAEPMVIAMKLAENDANMSVSNGLPRIKIRFEDGKSSVPATIAAYQRLIQGGAKACVVFGDVPCYNLAPMVNAQPIPVMTLSAADANITGLSSHYFRAWTTTRDSCSHLAAYAKESLCAKRLSILAINNNFGDEATKTVVEYAQYNDVAIVGAETFEIDAQDVRGQIQKLVSRRPDAMFVFGFGPGYIAAFNQLQEVGYAGKILTDEVVTIPGYSEKIVNGARGVYYSSTGFDPQNENSPYAERFVRPFFRKCNRLPNAHAAFAYFSIDVLARALAISSPDARDMERALKMLGCFSSVIGDVVFDEKGELKTSIEIRVKK